MVGVTGLRDRHRDAVDAARAVGLAEGAFAPAAIVAAAQASKPSRVGLNIGLQQVALPLFGLGLGPVLAIQLLKVLPSWHWVFGIAAVPGLILAVLLARLLRADPAPRPRAIAIVPSWREGFANRNVVCNALGMCCWVSCLVILSALLPNYLTDHLKLDLDEMSWVLSPRASAACSAP